MAYRFSSYWPLDFFFFLAVLDICQTYTDVANVIFFTLSNKKTYHKWKYQPLCMKVEEWAMLRLYKGYSILFSARVTKKLT